MLEQVSNLDTTLLLVNLGYIVLGFAIHVGKKYINDGIDPVRYLKEHAGRTGAAISAGVVSYGALMFSQPEAGPEAFIAIGYMVDSVFNRAPESNELADRLKSLKDREDAAREVEEDYARLQALTTTPNVDLNKKS